MPLDLVLEKLTADCPWRGETPRTCTKLLLGEHCEIFYPDLVPPMQPPDLLSGTTPLRGSLPKSIAARTKKLRVVRGRKPRLS